MIQIDLSGRSVTLELSEQEMRRHMEALPAFEPKVRSGYLKRYLEKVSSASRGAVLQE